MSIGTPDDDLLRFTAEIVAAHTAHNVGPGDELPGLIHSVYAALNTLGSTPVPDVRQEPAVPVKKSVFPDYLVCLEDGKKMKMLKRHLQNAYGMTPDQYRARWGLSRDYPMVAPNYSSRRSELAKAIGLGRRLASASEFEVPVRHIPAGKRGKKPRPKSRPLEQTSLLPE